MATPIPQNQAAFTLAEVLAATGGAVVSAGGPADGERTSSVSTDTRQISAGALFVALRGEAFDAHDHVATAVKSGARLVLVEREIPAISGAIVVRVASTLEALGALGRAHARRWRALGGIRRLVAITGSAGKTTTRVATQALLSRLHPGEVHATKGNLNNLVGTPMVLFGLTPQHRYGVIEIGTNRPGEIDRLARMVEPDVGVVTLVAEAHIEELGSLEGVAHEKAALFRALSPDGVAIGNGDDPHVRARIEASPARAKALYGTREGAGVRIVSRSPEGMTLSRVQLGVSPPARAGASDLGGTDARSAARGGIPPRTIDVVTPLLGEAGALACAAAVAVAEMGLDDAVTSEIAGDAFAAAEVGGGAGRLLPMRLDQDVVVIDDSYNANPASMKASIAAAAEIARSEGRRLVLVLGEMRELGAVREAAHDEVGRAARGSGAALVIAVGALAQRYTLQMLGSSITHAHVSSAADAAVFARERVLPGDLVLVKGSRGIGTDAVVRALREHFGSSANTDGGAGAHA